MDDRQTKLPLHLMWQIETQPLGDTQRKSADDDGVEAFRIFSQLIFYCHERRPVSDGSSANLYTHLLHPPFGAISASLRHLQGLTFYPRQQMPNRRSWDQNHEFSLGFSRCELTELR
jgi:hypothetical protein